MFPPKRSHVQIQRGVGYVYFGGGLMHQFVVLGLDLKNRLLLLLLKYKKGRERVFSFRRLRL
jgi:hypothetical protein